MLDKNKVAEKLASNSNTLTVGGPPGVKKNGVNKVVQKQLAKLIGADVALPDAGPTQAVAVKEGAPVKPSSKKAVRWLIKKLGEKGANDMAKSNGLSLKKYALAMYTEHLAAKAADKPKNDAMAALVGGSEKREARKAKKAAEEATARDKAIGDAVMSLKVSTNEALKNALNMFIDGPVKAMLDSFVTLYVARTDDGESDEAVLALDACRQAFDACGLILADVKTDSKKPKPIRADVPAEPTKKPHKAIRVEAKKPMARERNRKELTSAQREAKNKKDRARRAAAKKGGK